MNYYKIQLHHDDNQGEILLAFLSELPFDTFEEEANHINAYLPEKDWNDDTQSELNKIAARLQIQYETTFIPYQNWNAVWESNFQPIQVDDFCGIRADFHPKMDNVQYEITINPKMAFGTGHHATTFMMLQQMRSIDFVDKKVLDYGCGTGILAIVARLMGSTRIDAVDIELPSYENTIENARINNADNINVIHGVLEDVSGVGYDIILANINRNVILDSLPTLYQKLAADGIILFSGLLKEDENLIRERVQQHSFRVINQLEKDNWICLKTGKGDL